MQNIWFILNLFNFICFAINIYKSCFIHKKLPSHDKPSLESRLFWENRFPGPPFTCSSNVLCFSLGFSRSRWQIQLYWGSKWCSFQQCVSSFCWYHWGLPNSAKQEHLWSQKTKKSLDRKDDSSDSKNNDLLKALIERKNLDLKEFNKEVTLGLRIQKSFVEKLRKF